MFGKKTVKGPKNMVKLEENRRDNERLQTLTEAILKTFGN